MTTMNTLSKNLTLRHAGWADLEAVAQLIYDVCEADGDTTVANTPEELRNWWGTEGFNIETDAFVVEAQDGRLAGYEELFNENAHVHLNADGYVHPKFKGLGVGTSLLHAAEVRAGEHIPLAAPDLRVFIRVSTDSKDETGNAMFAHEGYSVIRHHWRMEIKLDKAPFAAILPDGIELRPFIREQHDRLVWEADNEAFRDHWGSHESTFEEWRHRKFGKSDFDPSLWMIAWDGDQIAGYSQNRFRMGIGWIGTLGVRRPWRKKGLGLALLQHSFGEFHKRGMNTIGLGVDASNPTGATRLYQRAGMYVASEFITYEKELRAGQNLEK
ncbi:MAG: GNAT family N-acetyltransferase [Anaerolineales bacterium]|nr:GNAT family N-acetyltransferase [Anaerolineales bacterium]